MKTITPEGWLLLKLPQANGKYVFKVFASWRENDQWRLSSGASSLEQAKRKGEYILFPQSSGTLYRLPIKGEGSATFYTMDVLERMLAKEGIALAQVKLKSSSIVNS